MKEIIDYFKGDELAASTWLNKYSAEGDKTPDDMHWRMAEEFFRVGDKYPKYIDTNTLYSLSEYGRLRQNLSTVNIYSLFKDFKHIVPGGSIMASLGLTTITSLSNCFVIGSPLDSYTSIMKTRTEQAHLMKRRGGVGYDISGLRPKGAKVSNAAKTATGPASFMEVNSEITKEVAQDGRRGALMLTIDIRHPDSLDFILKKQDLTKVTGANVSVKVPDDFMEAVIKDEDYLLRWPVDDVPQYTRTVKAKELWNQLIHAAWNTAEPGIIFIDRMHKYSPDGGYIGAKAISTNPCGEIPLGAYDSCRLMHINFTSFVKSPYEEGAYVDEAHLYEVAYETMVLADNLVDLETEAIDRILLKVASDKDFVEEALWQKIKDTAIKFRRTGIGFTGLADVYAMLGVKYGSDAALHLTQKMLHTKLKAELDATIDMAILRGSFPEWDRHTEHNEWFDFIKETYPEQYERMKEYGRRNLSFSTVAPTGTVSIMTQTSSGIEPVFMPYYMRRRRVSNSRDKVDFVDRNGEKFTEFAVLHPELIKWFETKNENNTREFLETLSQKELDVFFEASPWYGSTSPEIAWDKRVSKD